MGCHCGKATQVNELGPVVPTTNQKTAPKSASSTAASKSPTISPDIVTKKLAQAKSTRILAFRECGLQMLPPAATTEEHANLRTADLAVNSLTSLPETIKLWSGLQTLLCASNALEGLPSAVGHLTSLHKLVLSENQLRTLPSELALLGKLRVLTLDCNKLGPTLPDVFTGELAGSLEDLDLSNNMLKDLAPSLSGLRALTRLAIAKNVLQSLPEALGCLGKLQYLDASHNKIDNVVADIFACQNLSELWLKGNPVDRLKLQEVPGFDKFMERRKNRLDSKIDSNVVGSVNLSVCGLD